MSDLVHANSLLRAIDGKAGKAALVLAASLLLSSGTSAAQSAIAVARAGSQPSTMGAAENFTGSVRVDSHFQRPAPARVGGGIVTFEPGAHTAWHSHPLGQTLIVTAGVGLVRAAEGPAQRIAPGDVVWIPPGVRHWHGATRNTGMSHIALAEALDGKTTDWMEHVSEADYAAAQSE